MPIPNGTYELVQGASKNAMKTILRPAKPSKEKPAKVRAKAKRR